MAALICREMGWTWQEYQEQPSWFTEIVLAMLQAESDEIKKQTKEIKS